MKGNQKTQQGRGATTSRHRPTIGVFLEYVTTYDLALWSGIAEVAQKQNVNLISFMGRRLRDPEGFVAQNNVIYSLVNPQNVDGLIFFSAAITPYLTSPEITAFFQCYNSLPQVSIGQVIENVPSIMVDSRQGLQDLLTHLIRDHDYRQIAFITGPESHPDALERLQIYKDVLAQHHLPFNPDLVVSGDFKADSGRKAMQILLDKNDLKIEAVFAANDHMAISAIKVLQQRGIDIPGAIAVVGFDDVKECRYSIPPLSTVRQPMAQLGRLAAEMILAQLNGETVPLRVVLPTEAIIRQSCGCLSQMVRQAEVQSTFFSPLPGQPIVEFQLSPAQRQTILLEMEKVLQVTAINGGASLTLNQLLDVFLTNLRQETSNVFLATLGHVWREAILAEKDFTFWQEVLSTMRRYILPYLGAGPVLFRAENLWYQAQILLGEMRGQAEAHHWLQLTLQARLLARISQRLITTFNTGQLMDTIANMLPQLGLKSGYLSLYEPQTISQGQAPLYARMILAFNETRRFELEPEGVKFPSQFLTPVGNFLPDRQHAMLVMSLYFGDNQLGFILLEMGPQESVVYQTLQDQISSALEGALLVQQVQNHALNLELVNTELRATQERLIRQEKLAALGQLASGVAHEIRNPLGVIANALYFLQLTSPDAGETTQNYFDLIADRINDTEKIMSALLDFTHTRLPTPETIAVGRLVAEVLERNPPPGQVRVTTAFASGLPPVFVDATQIGQQVLANLVTNAYQAMPNGGDLTISAHSEGGWLKLSLADTGVGMSPETLEKIFEPLFTTKAKGIGLGLAVSKNLVEVNGGTIEVKSIEGQGAVFTIILPAR